MKTHLGLHTWATLLPSTKLHFLVELRRPRDPLEVAKHPRYNTRNLRDNRESLQNSKLNACSFKLVCHYIPKASLYIVEDGSLQQAA